jgi:acetylornithine deacetylase/succinyl-diaminopimelate desuccinylase-like protein
MLIFLLIKYICNLMIEKVAELLRELVDIASPPGKEDKLAGHIEEKFEKLGYEAERFQGNLLLNPEADFWVATHLDALTVSSEFRISQGYASGPGVCDANAGIAAMLLALERIAELKLGFALFVEEETTGRGSALIAEHYSPRRCVVLEPTSLRIAKEQYGGIELTFSVTGKAAHAAVPERGVNAVERAFALLKELRKLPANVNILKIEGGSDIYAIPESCTMVVDIIFPPGVSLAEVHSAALRLGKAYGSVEVVEKEEAFNLDGEAAKLLEEALKRVKIEPQTSAMPSWCDASNLKKAGWDVVVFGPGELAPCHTQRERVSLREVLLTSRVIEELNALV